MPSTTHPQAKFDPIPPDLDLATLVEKTDNFDYVIRIHVDQIEEIGLDQFEKLLLLHVVKDGKPLVIEGWDTKLKPWLFNAQWLADNCGKKEEMVRDISNGVDIPMTMGHYLRAMEKLTNQWTPSNFRDSRRQRLYLKDIDCPEAWYQQLEKVMPSLLFYLNESVGAIGGPGAHQERNAHGQPVLGRGVAPAGDLMSSLPPEMRAENMMCYIGHEGTYTPAHREMCASLGQNVMVETSDIQKGEQPGSSIWFMTETKEREVVSEYFLSMLGHDIEVESHFAQINAWKKAPFRVYIVEQKVGDFILIPPLAPHQVWNRGTRTMKAAWNRTTVETLELAIHEALPRARMVCRDEQYKNKAIIYYTLQKYYQLLKKVEPPNLHFDEYSDKQHRVLQLERDFKRLHALYTEVLLTEMFSPDHPVERNIENLPFDSNVTCSYCRCNIFNRFLTCKTCVGVIEGSNDEDTYDICMECFAMGRSCYCISKLQWVEQWKWDDLVKNHEKWRELILEHDIYVGIDASPQTFEIAREKYSKKSVAQICQEQLKLRPWRDITKPPPTLDVTEGSDVEPECDDKGRPKKKKARKSQRRAAISTKTTTCHVCRKQEWNWKMAFCSECTQAYCYGVLWRAFDLMPQTVMENPNWKCPKCLQMCSCGACRKDPVQASGAYRPKGTLLGHDTKKVADIRSVESLVDFSRTNLNWLRGDGDDDPQGSQRMQKLMKRAEAEKARHEALDDDPLVMRQGSNSDHSQSQDDVIAIDPQLQAGEGVDSNGAQAKKSKNHNSGTHDLLHAPIPVMVADDFSAAETRHFSNHIPHTHTERPDDPHTSNQEPCLTESLYPDPMSRGMGFGYYQQANDSDRILYDAPDAETPRGHVPKLAYPKLPSEPSRPPMGVLKRKRDIGKPSSDTGDSAHAQFIQARKKQKLDNAKSNNSYYKTVHQLSGGMPLIIKLPLANQKDFLRDLESGSRPRSTRPLRSSTGKIDRAESNDSEPSTIIVRSDVRSLQGDEGSPEEEERKEDSKDEDFFSGEERRATFGRLQKHGIRKNSRKAQNTHIEDVQNDASQKSSSNIGKRSRPRGSRSKAADEDARGEDIQEVELSSHARSGADYPSWLSNSKVNNSISITQQSPEQKKTSRRSATFKNTPEQAASPSTSECHEELSSPFAREVTPVVDLPEEPESSPARQPTEAEMMEDNRRAKMMVMEELESEPQSYSDGYELMGGGNDANTIISKPSQVRVSLSKAAASPTVRDQVSRNVNFTPTAAIRISASEAGLSSPEAPRGKLLTMAERRALQGRKIRIVGDKIRSNPTESGSAGSSANTNPKINSARPSSKVPRSVAAISKVKVEPRDVGFESVSGISSSDDDDDDSIPMVRPPEVTTSVSSNDRSLLSATRGLGGLNEKPRSRGRSGGRGV